MSERLSYATIDRGGDHTGFMVLLHGYGEPASDLTDRLDLLDPDGRYLVIVPEAPFEWRDQVIWHRAASALDEYVRQYLASLRLLDELLGEIEQETGLPAAEAVVGGFSQGGGLAIGLLLGADVVHRPARGFGVCSFPPVVKGFRVDRDAAAGRRYFLSSARRDRFAAIELSRECAVLLRDVGIDLTYVEADGEHFMTDEAAAQIGKWLAGRAPESAPEDANLLADVTGRRVYDDLWDFIS